jgi:hypothetical protein
MMFEQCVRLQEGLSLGEPQSFAARCQLALLTGSSADALLPLIEEGFTTLWSRENQYNPVETELSVNLLLRALGKKDFPPPTDPYFAWLYEQNPRIEPLEAALDYQLFKEDDAALVLTQQVQAGAFRLGSIQVVSFGPHTPPLSHSDLYGISGGDNGWVCAKGDKASWFHIAATDARSFTIQSITEHPIPFAFYVRADTCEVGGKLFRPKNLQRFEGTVQIAKFSHLHFTVDRPLTAELIPLAGEGSFWGASFLLAFHIPPNSGKIKFGY